MKYDSRGRMLFDPEIHAKHGTPWTTTDQKYLIENYDKASSTELSYALERTPGVILDKVCRLRKAGLMK